MNNGGCDRNAECTQTGPNQVSTLLVKKNGPSQVFTMGKERFPHVNFVFKWKNEFHNNSEEYMLPSKRHLRRSADKNEKKSISVKEIQNCRGKQCFAISSGCFSPSWEVLM